MRRISVGDIIIGKEEKKEINKVLDSNWLSEGKKVHEFERKWSEFIETKYCVLTNSGTSALIAGLKSLMISKEIPEKSKVITTPLTYIATINAIVHSNLEPVFVDVEKDTFTIDVEKIKEILEKDENFKLILPVHLMGYVADMDKINNLAKKYKMHVVEDAAQAHGSLYKGKKVGSLSDFSIFSFYIAHNIQVGEMGAMNTNDPEIKRLVTKIKNQGRFCDCNECTRKMGYCAKNPKMKLNINPKFTHDIIGYNFKASEFNAAIGLAQLEKIDWVITKRKENVKYLNEELEKFSDILKLPPFSNDISYLAYPLVIKNQKVISMKKLIEELEKRGIETRPLFGCIPTQQPAYAFMKKKYDGKLPTAEYLGLNAFYIGCHQYLNEEDINYIVETFKEILKG
jgi:CDP-6-deoxy-D-xylo-4-hexulose-3-dehydrase